MGLKEMSVCWYGPSDFNLTSGILNCTSGKISH